ncbi:unnamed protein product, partial [Caretta caretta]
MSCFTNVWSEMPQNMHDSCNKSPLRQCPDSTMLIQPPPAAMTFPGAILSSFLQESSVGSSGAAHIRG